MKQGFIKKIYRNKYRSEITSQPKSSNLACKTEPTFKVGNNDFTSNYFAKSQRTISGNKPCFYQPIKKKQEAYENLSS